MHTLRRATPDDAEVLAELRRRMFADIGWSEGTGEDVVIATVEYFGPAVADGRYVAFIAEDGGAPIGTAGAVVTEVPPYAEDLSGRIPRVQGVYVVPECRRQGVARELFGRLLETLQAEGFRRVTLMATDEGRPLYEEFGFEPMPEMSVMLEPAGEVASDA